MNIFAFILAVLIYMLLYLSSCESTADDRCERQKRFDTCLSISATARPDGDESEWDEVVERCDMVAAQQSRKPFNQIKKECL